MNILGVDPSLTATGLALYSKLDGLQTATVKSKPMGAGHLGDALRIRNIVGEVSRWTRGAYLDLVVIEGPAFSRNTGHAHERAGLWWAVYSRFAVENTWPVLVVEPNLRAKYATGRGNAGKDEVMLAAARRYPNAGIANNNEADAVLLAAMGARVMGAPFDTMPKAHLAALRTVAFPPILAG